MTNDKVLEKIKKLLALASNNPSEHEARAAMLKAQELIKEYHIENPETIEEDRVVSAFYDLGTRTKTEFELMIAVVVARNFRSKMVHSNQSVFFIGFEADAKAAVEVFVYLLNFSDSAYSKYFQNRPNTAQAASDWKNGFIVGLHIAFNSRAGYELMITVPQKVIETFEKLNTKKMDTSNSNRPKTIAGAFTDGFRRGRESMDKREIEAK